MGFVCGRVSEPGLRSGAGGAHGRSKGHQCLLLYNTDFDDREHLEAFICQHWYLHLNNVISGRIQDRGSRMKPTLGRSLAPTTSLSSVSVLCLQNGVTTAGGLPRARAVRRAAPVACAWLQQCFPRDEQPCS